MIGKNNILDAFLIVLVSICLLPSCVSTDGLEMEKDSGTIEFVVRPTSYNGKNVDTKATNVDDFENKIHCCYFALYNAEGQRVYGPIDLNATLVPQRISRHELQSMLGGLTTCTACFIANVPKSIVEGLTTLTAVNETVLDIAYNHEYVTDSESAARRNFFAVPEFVLEDGTEAVQCLPMFGMEECKLEEANLFQIPLERLFAKVSVNISVASLATFDIMAAHLINLPTKVRLTETDVESAWVKESSAFYKEEQGAIDIEPIDNEISGGVSGVFGSSYGFYFYVPEYCLLPEAESLPGDDVADGEAQKLKPTIFDKEKFPILIRLFGNYKSSSSSAEQPVTYDLYLGENSSTSFSFKRNTHYKNNVQINGVTNSKDGETGVNLDWRVTLEELDEVEILGQTANCYIIGKSGTYTYPAYKGVWKRQNGEIPEGRICTKGTRLEVLHSDNPEITLANLTYNSESNEFSFDITMDTNGEGTTVSNDGNVILGLVYTEDGVEKVEWSWHLWVIDGAVFGFDSFDIETDTYPNNYILLDRNLGARPTSLQKSTPGVVTGLYYKYGHKEPYIDNKYWGDGESSSYDWSGDDKSQTDPCPPGYRVPSKSVWEGSSDQLVALNNSTNGAFEYWSGVYYPYSGYLNENNEQIKQVSLSHVQSDTYTGVIEYLNTKYRNIKYSTTFNYTAGALLGTDKTLIYEGVDQGFLSNMEIITCEKYTWHFSWSGSYYSWDSYTPSGTLANVLIDGVKTEIEKTLTDYMRKLQYVDANPSYGYQVRCVKE